MDMNLGKLWAIMRDRGVRRVAVHGVAESDSWETEQQQQHKAFIKMAGNKENKTTLDFKYLNIFPRKNSSCKTFFFSSTFFHPAYIFICNTSKRKQNNCTTYNQDFLLSQEC